MDAETLRVMQAPLRHQNNRDSDSALVTLKAQSRISEDTSCQLDTDAAEDQIASLLKPTERDCVVFQTLKHPRVFTVTRQP